MRLHQWWKTRQRLSGDRCGVNHTLREQFQLAALSGALQLLPNAKGFGAVIHQGLFEPRVLQSFLGSDAVLRVIHEDLLQEIEEQFMKLGVGWDEFLRLVSNLTDSWAVGPHTGSCFIARTYLREARVVCSLGYSSRLRLKYLRRSAGSQMEVMGNNILGSLVLGRAASSLHHLPHKAGVDPIANDSFHHR